MLCHAFLNYASGLKDAILQGVGRKRPTRPSKSCLGSKPLVGNRPGGLFPKEKGMKYYGSY